MKPKLNLIILICFVSNLIFGNEWIQKAKSAYEKADYATSISYYEKVLTTGETSALLHFNLANAYFKNNEIGKAIYQYHLAHKLDPSDNDIKHNLTIACTKTKDQIENKENYFVKNIESGILTTYSLNGWAWSSIISLTFALSFFIVFLLNSNFKKIFFWLGAIHVLIFIGSLAIGFAALNEVKNKNHAIVLSNEVSVVNAPTHDGKEQFKLHEGTKVSVLESNEKWTSIQLENGNEGWLQTTHLGLF
jgi:tetratricopeptide (TPR) repeat protein